MKYRVRYTDKTDYSQETRVIVEAAGRSCTALSMMLLEQLPDHIVILSALQTNL